MKQGIIILALKKDAYYCGAFNLALSIKYHNPNINITLLSDGGHTRVYDAFKYSVFDNIKEIDKADYTDKNSLFCPAKAKLNINKYSPYDNTLYIDSDSLVLKDIATVLDKLVSLNGNFYAQYFGTGGINDSINYNEWAENNLLWEFFKLKKTDKINTVNSSWMFFNKNTDKLFNKFNDNYNKVFPIEMLKKRWGGTLPDELFIVGTLAQMDINPNSGIDLMFFGNELDSRSVSQLELDYYAFTLFGGGVGRTTVRDKYITWYDRILFKMLNKYKQEHRFKADLILKNKHVNR